MRDRTSTEVSSQEDSTIFRPDNTVVEHLVHAEDLITIEEQTDCIYEVKCVDCDVV